MSRRARGEGSIYQRRDGRWEGAAWLLTSSGRRKRVRVYGKTRGEAHIQLTAALSRSQSGQLIPDRNWQVGPYLQYWLAHVVRPTKRPRTYERYESLCRRHLIPDLGSLRLNQLTVPRLQVYFDDQLQAGRSVRTVQQQRTTLSGALTHAMREELLVRNPARLVQLPEWIRKDIQPWSADEVHNFLEVAGDDPLYPAFVLLAHYGLRRGEVLGLSWSDVDLEQGELRVHKQLQRLNGALTLAGVKTKSGIRTLQLTEAPRAALMAISDQPLAEREGLVFTTRYGTPIEPGNLLRSMDRICHANGIRRMTPHYLRHSAATLLKNTGIPPRDTQLILGHSSIITTLQLYQHADPVGQSAALNKLGGVLAVPRVSRHSRQIQPSKSDSVLKRFMINSGGPGGTRTLDTLLKSPTWHFPGWPLTSVHEELEARLRLFAIGRVAVRSGRQSATNARAHRLGHLILNVERSGTRIASP